MKIFNIKFIYAFILFLTLISFSSAVNCFESGFYNGVDLNSGKIHYSLAPGAYYSESPCFSTNLASNIVVSNYSMAENRIIYYPNSSRVGLIDFFNNASFFYTYLGDNKTLSEVYFMISIGKYSMKTNFSYNLVNLSSINNYFSNGELVSSLQTYFSPTLISFYNNEVNESFFISDNLIKYKQQTFLSSEINYSLLDSFYYYKNSTVVLESFNDSIIDGFVYDKNTGGIYSNETCREFGEFVLNNLSIAENTCESSTQLKKYYCGVDLFRWDFWNSFRERVVKSNIVNCEFGCENGACLNEQIPIINQTTIDSELPPEPSRPSRL